MERRIIAAINMSLDGNCDHTAGLPDEAVHQHYADLVRESGVILYGRKTYELMKYWQPFVKNPSGDAAGDDFAKAIDAVPKVVFSNQLKKGDPSALGWKSARLSDLSPEEEVLSLRQKPGKDILVGSRSLIIQLLERGLVDELQICIYPLIAGEGMRLFENVKGKILLELKDIKRFGGGAVILCYRPLVG